LPSERQFRFLELARSLDTAPATAQFTNLSLWRGFGEKDNLHALSQSRDFTVFTVRLVTWRGSPLTLETCGLAVRLSLEPTEFSV